MYTRMQAILSINLNIFNNFSSAKDGLDAFWSQICKLGFGSARYISRNSDSGALIVSTNVTFLSNSRRFLFVRPYSEHNM